MESLRILIAIGDDGGIILAEEVVNEYLAAFPVKQHAGALHLLQDAITPLWRGSSGTQTEFINMVFDTRTTESSLCRSPNDPQTP
jgi:hypothetical protein